MLLLVLALWIALPKVYVHEWLGHDHGSLAVSHDLSFRQLPLDDCDFEKYNKPLLFHGVDLEAATDPTPQIITGVSNLNTLVFLKSPDKAHCLRGPPASR